MNLPRIERPAARFFVSCPPGGRRRERAFSLIEIAIALGILAFSLIPVLGLMPIGLTTLRDTVDTAVSAQIAQTIVNQAEQADYNSLPTAAPQNYYFDEQGDLLPSATGALYLAQLAVSEPTSIPVGPNASSAIPSNPNLATLTITVQLLTTRATRTLSALVARATQK